MALIGNQVGITVARLGRTLLGSSRLAFLPTNLEASTLRYRWWNRGGGLPTFVAVDAPKGGIAPTWTTKQK